MKKRWLLAAAFCTAGVVGFVLTAPDNLDPETLVDPATDALRVGDAAAGETVFIAAGCASCHAAEGTDALAGGKAFASAYGTFYAPNISTDVAQGVGGWSVYELANAIQAGIAPNGAHYYPAFPFAAYANMTPQDTVNLIAHLRTLPADATPSRDHDLAFPFNIRRSVGVWKALYVSGDWVVADAPTPELERGRYLVEALGHCAECHTPRNALGGLQTEQWMRGAPNPSGNGTIPSIHPDDLSWSAQDIAIYLDSGFTPDFDTVGGSMVDVVDNTSQLSDQDRDAIAAYLLALD